MSIAKPYTWIHSDLMDDNILMKPCYLSSCFGKNASYPSEVNNGCGNICNFWQPCHIIDFSDLSVGEFYLLVLDIVHICPSVKLAVDKMKLQEILPSTYLVNTVLRLESIGS